MPALKEYEYEVPIDMNTPEAVGVMFARLDERVKQFGDVLVDIRQALRDMAATNAEALATQDRRLSEKIEDQGKRFGARLDALEGKHEKVSQETSDLKGKYQRALGWIGGATAVFHAAMYAYSQLIKK